MNGQQIVDEARTWLGTPFKHQGRLKGVGSDCIGIVLEVGKSLGLIDLEVSGYGRSPDGILMQKTMDSYLDKVSFNTIQPGDILLMKFETLPQHVAFYTDIGILHSYQHVRKCIETSLDETWKNRIVAVYRFKGANSD